MLDAPSQGEYWRYVAQRFRERTAPTVNDGICMAVSKTGYLRSQAAGHHGRHVAQGDEGRITSWRRS